MFSGLNHLASSQSKQFNELVFVRVYQSRQDGISDSLVESVAQQLSIDVTKTKELLASILHVSKQAVYYNCETIEMVKRLY